MAKARVKVPKSVKKGQVFEVKSLVSHKMETGLRKNKKTGKKIPRKILNKFSVTYGGKEVFSADWHPAVSANPYTSFFVKAGESGPMVLKWTEDGGKVTEKTVKINVSG
ncbi:MAG: thiosulfate oxidation carrier complex protein SoxZ [Alphaproteobacteria bacterium]|mgnify:FL=1|jgi:sulfur-oxidizing protein SoxZ|nr:thiosulfate oxidation carrier complex protein SoxZ [Alphaproteobacteria bacterium]